MWISKKHYENMKAIVEAAQVWAYCPEEGGYRDGPAVEDTCEQLAAEVEAYTGIATRGNPWWTIDEMRAELGKTEVQK